MFEDRRTALLFPGTGQSLAGEENAKSHRVESHTPVCLVGGIHFENKAK